MHLAIAAVVLALLARLGLRPPARLRAAAARVHPHLAIALAIGVTVVVLFIVLQRVDLGALGQNLFRTIRALHGG